MLYYKLLNVKEYSAKKKGAGRLPYKTVEYDFNYLD